MAEEKQKPVETTDFSFSMNTATAQQFVRALRAINDECKLHVEESGISTRIVDPANVGMVAARMPAGVGDAGKLTNIRGGGEIGLDIKKLDDVLKVFKAETVDAEYTVDTRKLVLKSGAKTMRMSTLDPASIRKEPKVPGLNDLPVEATITYDAFGEVVGDVNTVIPGKDAHIVIGALLDNPSNVLVFHAADDLNQCHWDFSAEPDGVLSAFRVQKAGGEPKEYDGYKANYRSVFSMDYMTDITKGLRGAPLLKMTFGTDYPLVIESVGQYIELKYLLAPRIESE